MAFPSQLPLRLSSWIWPGTIVYALSLPIGSAVYLDAVYVGTSGAQLTTNDVFGNTRGDYVGEFFHLTDIREDPEFAESPKHNYHIQPNSRCIDTGHNAGVQPDQVDMDGQPRIYGEAVDIGADESDGCGWYSITFSADPDPGQANQLVTVTANVEDWYDQDVGGVTVHFSVAEGTITEVNETPLQPPATTASGDTDPSSGNAVIKITRPDAGKVTVTAKVISSCGIGDTTRSTDIIFRVKVGFIYDLCSDTYVAEDVDDFLGDISSEYEWVHYERISIPFTIDPSLNTVFLVLPTRALQTSETASLVAFILSGRDKRIVLIGEFNPDYSQFNIRLNTIAGALGVASQFSTSGTPYDRTGQLCTLIDQNHYLMDNVVGLRDWYTSPFAIIGAQAQSLAWICEHPSLRWILAEDVPNAGDIVLVHDSDLMDPYFQDDIPDKNFKFVYNLCTIFPD